MGHRRDKNRLFWIGLLFVFSFPLSGSAPILFRISVENAPSHVQTQYVEKFAQALEAEMPGVFQVQFFHSAQLYGDREVVAALARGNLEMAVPGTWQLDRFVPEISVFLLPEFFGQNGQANDRYLTSPQGRLLLTKLENDLGVRIPGLWMDLGAAHVFTTQKQIRDYEDLRGLRIRVAGGEANRLRIDAFGGTGVIVAWADLIPWLRDGSVDGVLTSCETIRSALLWEQGIRYAYLDNQYFPQYVPLVSERVYRRLTSAQWAQFQAIWNRIAQEERQAAQQAQLSSRAELERRGILVTIPTQEAQQQARQFLLGFQDQLVQQLAIDRRFLP